MSQNLEMEARLWEYIDGIAKPEERSVIEALIQTQQEWREKYQEMVALHQDLQEHQRTARALEIFAPYHGRITQELDKRSVQPQAQVVESGS